MAGPGPDVPDALFYAAKRVAALQKSGAEPGVCIKESVHIVFVGFQGRGP